MGGFDYDIGIIGGGAAGLTVAAGAAQLGAKALLLEKSARLGGDCLHVGCVPSKTLIRTAGVWALARRAREFGLPALSLPPVDLGAVMDRVRAVIERIQEHDSPERFCRLSAEVRFGQGLNPLEIHSPLVDLVRNTEQGDEEFPPGQRAAGYLPASRRRGSTTGEILTSTRSCILRHQGLLLPDTSSSSSCRLLKKDHLRRFPPPSSLRRTTKYVSLLRTSEALHLGIFEQPVQDDFFKGILVI